MGIDWSKRQSKPVVILPPKMVGVTIELGDFDGGSAKFESTSGGLRVRVFEDEAEGILLVDKRIWSTPSGVRTLVPYLGEPKPLYITLLGPRVGTSSTLLVGRTLLTTEGVRIQVVIDTDGTITSNGFTEYL